MRIVGGKYKRRRFEVPKTFKARPTTDFAKENIFNVLANQIDFEDGISALDLFSGTGSIAVELLSRGCRRVVAVEKDQLHCGFIKKVFGILGDDSSELVRGDVFRYIKGCGEQFDYIFADPPYSLPEIGTLPSLILDECDILRDGGLFVFEHGENLDFAGNPHFLEHREYGSVNFTIFSKERAENTDD